MVPTDDEGQVLEFVEKPEPGTAPTNLINAGTYVLEPTVLARIPGGRRVSIERETFPSLVADGVLYALASDTGWIDAGTPATYLAANLEYAADPNGSTRIGEGATVKDSLLGDNVTVGPGAVVDGSLLLDGATVGPDAEIRSSIVGSGARIGDGASVTDLTVVGDAAVVAPGSRLSGGRHPDAP